MDGAYLDGRELRVSMAKYARPSYDSNARSGRRGGRRYCDSLLYEISIVN